MIVGSVSCGDMLLKHRNECAQMHNLCADLPLRAIDVDLLPCRPRMIGTHRADACNLCTRLIICAAARQRRRTDIAHLCVLGQCGERFPHHLRRAGVFLRLVERVCAQQTLPPQLRHILQSKPPL